MASVAAATGGSATVILLARLLAGAGAAMIMPVTLSVVTSSFPADKRANAIGVWPGFAGAGGILGLFFSAAMVDWVTWRWVFAMPLVLCVVGFALTLVAVGNSRELQEHSFDVLGGVLSAIAIGGTVLAFHEGPEHGWAEPLTLVGMAAAVTGAVLAGMGLVMTPSTVAITESLPVEKQGVASALNDTVLEVGGAIRVALLGSVLSSGCGSSIAGVASTLPEPVRQPVEDGIGTALAVAPSLGDQAPTVVGAARQAFVDGWHQTMWVAAAIAVGAVVLLLLTAPRTPKPVPADAAGDGAALAPTR